MTIERIESTRGAPWLSKEYPWGAVDFQPQPRGPKDRALTYLVRLYDNVGGTGYFVAPTRIDPANLRDLSMVADIAARLAPPALDGVNFLRALNETWAEIAEPIEGEAIADGPEPVNWADFWARDHLVEDWLLEPLIPMARSVSIYSPAKSGKSLLSLDLAARLATGRRVMDRPAGEPLNVVYLDMEMTEGDLQERLADMGYGPDDDLSHLHYYLLPSLPPLDTPEGGDALVAIARRHNADMVVIDTTSRVLSGDENASDSIRAFYMHTGLPLKADGRTVLRLDHAGKDLGRGQRGTSAKNDDVDLVWELTAQDDDGVKLRATHRRQSWIPEVVDLVRLEDPLRHERAAHTWPSGTVEVARTLDELGAPMAGNRAAQKLLREAGYKYRNGVVAAALRYRNSTGNTSGNTSSNGNGEHLGEQSAIRFGEHLGERGEHPFTGSGEHVPSLRGERFPAPVFEPSDPHPCAECGDPIVGTVERCIDCAADSVAAWKAARR
ncbi:MAG: AAA family ATPase [Dehalococcoidia bacterium]|nr:AAA family ATPase [Dehalococcoidia bacterium]